MICVDDTVVEKRKSDLTERKFERRKRPRREIDKSPLNPNIQRLV